MFPASNIKQVRCQHLLEKSDSTPLHPNTHTPSFEVERIRGSEITRETARAVFEAFL